VTRDELIARIGEAYEVYRRLPDPDRKYRVAKMATWPHYVREAADVAMGYGYRGASEPRIPPSPRAIDRADELLGWFATILVAHPKGANALWLTYGSGLSLERAARRLKCSRMTIMRRRDAAMAMLLARLGVGNPEGLEV
jgi:hypothetical protein